MARAISSGNYLSNGSAVLTAAPLTMACWFKHSSGNRLMCVDNNSLQHRFLLDVASSAVRITATVAGTGTTISTTTTFSADTWAHACGVIASATDRRVFLNGGGKQTSAVSRVPTGLSRTWIGEEPGNSAPLVGDLGEAAIWSVALSDAEVAALATGISPYEVQRANLVAYWPILGLTSPEPDVVGVFPLTLVGTPAQAATHPFMFYGKNRFRRRGLLAA